jgi:hypothetical protein
MLCSVYFKFALQQMPAAEIKNNFPSVCYIGYLSFHPFLFDSPSDSCVFILNQKIIKYEKISFMCPPGSIFIVM